MYVPPRVSYTWILAHPFTGMPDINETPVGLCTWSGRSELFVLGCVSRGFINPSYQAPFESVSRVFVPLLFLTRICSPPVHSIQTKSDPVSSTIRAPKSQWHPLNSSGVPIPRTISSPHVAFCFVGGHPVWSHCCLLPFWGRQEGITFNHSVMVDRWVLDLFLLSSWEGSSYLCLMVAM